MDKHTSLWAHLAGWFTAIFGGLTLEKFAVMVGIATSIGTFLVNWYYQRKRASNGSKD